MSDVTTTEQVPDGEKAPEEEKSQETPQETSEEKSEEKPETNETKESDVSKIERRSRSGAERRRYKYLLAKGCDRETAREKAKQSMKDIKDEEDSKTDKEEKPTSIKIGIIPSDFPTKRLENEEINSLRREVLNLILEQKGQAIKPRFTNQAIARSGWMIFDCANEETANWLKSQEIWANKGLITIEKDKFPEEHILVGNFKQSAEEETSFILGIIEGQNDDMDTSKWRIVERKNENDVAIITVEVTAEAFAALKKINFLVHYAFGQTVKFKIQGKKEDEPKHSYEPRKMSSSARRRERSRRNRPYKLEGRNDSNRNGNGRERNGRDRNGRDRNGRNGFSPSGPRNVMPWGGNFSNRGYNNPWENGNNGPGGMNQRGYPNRYPF